MAAIASQALRLLSDFTLHGLANTAWAFSALEVGHSPLLASIASSAIPLLRGLGMEHFEGMRSSTGSERPADVLGLIGAVTRMGAGADSDQGGARASEAWRGTLLREAKRILDCRGAHMDEVHPSKRQQFSNTPITLGSQPCIIHQHPDLCVLWKPPGWSVTVGGGGGRGEEWEETSAGAELGRPLQEWVEESLGLACPIARDSVAQHGILHRLDRDTSGVLALATSYRGYHAAHLCFTAKGVRKDYVCLCWGHLPLGTGCPVVQRWEPGEGLMLTAPLTTVALGSVRRSVAAGPGEAGREARTEVLAAAHLHLPKAAAWAAAFSLVEVRLHTGRLHQIRAHLAHEGHPLVGDASYGSRPAVSWCPRIFLHAHRLYMGLDDHPVDVRCPLPPDLQEALGVLKTVRGAPLESQEMIQLWASSSS